VNVWVSSERTTSLNYRGGWLLYGTLIVITVLIHEATRRHVSQISLPATANWTRGALLDVYIQKTPKITAGSLLVGLVNN